MFNKSLKWSRAALFMQWLQLSVCSSSRFIALITGALWNMEHLVFISLWLQGMHVWYALCFPGQTPGGNVEATGQSGGSHVCHTNSRDVHLARGWWWRRRFRGQFKGQQSPVGAAQSARGNKADCTVQFLGFVHNFSLSPCQTEKYV